MTVRRYGKKRRPGVWTAFVLAIALMSGMVMPAGAAGAEAGQAKVTISAKKLKLKAGKKGQLTLKSGDEVITRGVKWKSSSKKVATVSKKGKVTAKKAGKATITATYKKKTYKCKVTVTAPKYKISKKKAALRPGASLTLKLLDGKKKVSKGVKWKSSNKKVATVSKKGKVKAKKVGRVTITATCQGKKYSCKLTVSKKAAKTETKKAEAEAEAEEAKAVEERAEEKQESADREEGTADSGKAASNSGKTDSGTTGSGSSSSGASSSSSSGTSGSGSSGTSGSSGSSSDTSGTSDQDSSFDFNRDCKVTDGWNRDYYIEYTDTADLPAQLDDFGYISENRGGRTVVGGNVRCEMATYTFTRLPQTYEDIKKIPLDKKFGPVAAEICALALYKKMEDAMTTHPIYDIMDYLNGPDIPLNGRSDIYYSMIDTLAYGKLAYFDGAAPENAYTPNKPYSFTLYCDPNITPKKAVSQILPGQSPDIRRVQVSFEGDDYQRSVDVYNVNRGLWYIWGNDWLHLVKGMKPVTAAD